MFSGLLLFLQVTLSSVTVVDGDTLHDNGRNSDYRLAGIDAPETALAKCDAERQLGEAASRRVQELVAAARSIIAKPAYDPRGRDRWPRDGFGRRIAIIELDGASLADTLVREGIARPYGGSGPRPDWCAAP
jgi:micrococcal nuclease